MELSVNDQYSEKLKKLNDTFVAFLEAMAKNRKDKSTIPHEKQLEKAAINLFKEQKAELIDRLQKLKKHFKEADPEKDFDDIMDWVFLNTGENFENVSYSTIAAAMASGGNDILAEIGMEINFNIKNQAAEQYLISVSADLITNINETTRSKAKDIVVKGFEEGKSYDNIADELIDMYDGFGIKKPQKHIKTRAHLIAVTEVGEAYEHGGFITAKDIEEYGVKMEKFWANSGDDRVSDGCKANTADGWIPIDQPHTSGHQKPLRFPGCRCYEKYRRAKKLNI